MTSFVLKKADKNIEFLLEKSGFRGSDLYSADVMAELVQQYRETLSKVRAFESAIWVPI